MSEYDNTNRGALFANKDRKTDKHPNATGTLNVGGVEYRLSAWTKTSKAGDRYQSLSVEPKEARQQAEAPREDVPFNDDIPFAFAFLAPLAATIAGAVYMAGGLVA